MSTPAKPFSTYAWEPTSDFLAAKYGLPREAIVRFDVNSSPTRRTCGTSWPALSIRHCASTRRATTRRLSPPRPRLTGGAGRAAAHRRSRRSHRPHRPRLLARGLRGRRRDADLCDVRNRLGAARRRGCGRPASGPDDAFRLDIAAIAKAARTAQLVWLCEPNKPNGRLRAAGACRRAAGEARDRRAPRPARGAGRRRGRGLRGIRRAFGASAPLRLPKLVAVRTLSKAHALAGARVGFAVAGRRRSRRSSRIGPPRRSAPCPRPWRRPRCAARSWLAQTSCGSRSSGLDCWAIWRAWAGGRTRPSRTSSSCASARHCCRVGRRDSAPAGTRAADVRAGPPFADCLRLTVRSAPENDRLIEAARGIPA